MPLIRVHPNPGAIRFHLWASQPQRLHLRRPPPPQWPSGEQF
jgi:hypothetical protein